MSLEREIIEGKFDIIDRNLRFLDEIKTLSPDKFVESYKDIQAAKVFPLRNHGSLHRHRQLHHLREGL